MAILTPQSGNLQFHAPDIQTGLNNLSGGLQSLVAGMQQGRQNRIQDQDRARQDAARNKLIGLMSMVGQQASQPVAAGRLSAMAGKPMASFTPQAPTDQELDHAAIEAKMHGVDTGGYDAMRDREMQGLKTAQDMKSAQEKAHADQLKDALSVYRDYQKNFGALANFMDEVDRIIESKGLEGGEKELNAMKGAMVSNITRAMSGTNVNLTEFNNVLRMLLDEDKLKAYNTEMDAIANMDRDAVIEEINKAVSNPMSLVSNPGKIAALAAKANLIGLDDREVQGALNNALNKAIGNADIERIMNAGTRMLPQDYYSVAEMAAQSRKDTPRDFSRYKASSQAQDQTGWVEGF